jgi:parallel beta-helix repeat protein
VQILNQLEQGELGFDKRSLPSPFALSFVRGRVKTTKQHKPKNNRKYSMLNCKQIGLLVTAVMASGLMARADIRSDIQNATYGQTITCSGTYTVTNTITVPSGVTVKGPATFKFTNATKNGFVVPAANGVVTLQSLTVQGCLGAFKIQGSNCAITSCTANGCYYTGFELNGSKSKNNTFTSCKAYNNADSTGGNADGFAGKNSCSSGNKFQNCTAYANSDDGFDYYYANYPIVTSGCSAYGNGYYGGKTGNGVGYKMGGSGTSASHTFTSCTGNNNTSGNTARGFDSNNNGARLYLTTCKSYSNKNKDRLVNCQLTNCTMQQ